MTTRPSQQVTPITTDNGGDAQTTQRVIDAAIRCLDQLGLDKTTVDDIARESAISRATLYRRFGSKEAIFAAALQRESRPFESEASAILNGPGGLLSRIERLLVWAVIETPENMLLKRLLSNEAAQTGARIFNDVFRAKVSDILLPVVSAAKINGGLAMDLPAEFIVDWLLRELLMIKTAAPWQKEELQQHIQHFIRPVLCASPVAERNEPSAASLEGLQQRLTRMEERLVEVHQLLGHLRHDLRSEKD